MIVFDCAVCRTKLSAQPGQAGSWVLCPNCRTKLQVPKPASVPVGAASSVDSTSATVARPPAAPAPPRQSKTPGTISGIRPSGSFGKLYGFNCSYCSSRLEATESMAAQEGQCPTCGNAIIIPIKDKFGRLIDPKTQQIIKQDPHPVHAYAAAGDRAPTIIRQGDGKQMIRCGRCSAMSPITSNNCKACGMPFTMEGTTVEASGSSNGFSVAGLVLGIIGLPACVTLVPSLLAILFGSIGFYQITKRANGSGGKGMASLGITFGLIGLLCWAYYYFH